MELDSAIFLLFLGCVAVVHACLPPRRRVVALLIASLAFYASSSLTGLVLMLGLCGLNYRAALTLSRSESQRVRSWIFGGTVAVNLGVLIAFKYASAWFCVGLTYLGWSGQGGAVTRLIAPLGLSYFTFQMLACVTDAYRQNWRLEGGFKEFALFGLFFPQISSGPIPRAERLLPQLVADGMPNAEDRLEGMRMIALGFVKKYVVANRLNEYVTEVFTGGIEASALPTLLACCLNVLQLYADFSGYIDIAIGSARLLGIRLDPNFDRPFSSTSVTEFWRRWHITLALWLRDYLYMPLLIRIRSLGKAGVVLAMLITFGICGIWHAATWPFLLFGLTQGLALSAELLTKPWRAKRLKRYPEALVVWAGRCYTMGFFVLTQVLFRAADLPQALRIYGQLFHVQWPSNLRSAFGPPFYILMDCAAIVLWLGVVHCQRRMASRATPAFVLLCGLLLLFIGRLGAAHFIYATF